MIRFVIVLPAAVANSCGTLHFTHTHTHTICTHSTHTGTHAQHTATTVAVEMVPMETGRVVHKGGSNLCSHVQDLSVQGRYKAEQ